MKYFRRNDVLYTAPLARFVARVWIFIAMACVLTGIASAIASSNWWSLPAFVGLSMLGISSFGVGGMYLSIAGEVDKANKEPT